MEISPGEKAQDLHRDDFIWQRTHTGSEDSHKRGSDTSMGIIVAGMETTMANGATAVSCTSEVLRRGFDRNLCSLYPNRTCGTIPDVQRPGRYDTQK